MTRYLLNSAVIPAGDAGIWRYSLLDRKQAVAWLRSGPFLSRIGYVQNADILTRLSGIPVPVNRELHAMQPGDEALVMRLRYRVQGMKGGERFAIKDFEFGLLEYLKS